MTVLPFAVYGTLRPGGRFADRWSNGLGQHVNRGHVLGYRLTTNNAYPYAIPDENHLTVVDVIAHMPGKWEDLLRSFDSLEGYPTHYDRVVVTVATQYGDVQAWLYTPASRHFDHFPPVPGNDWMTYVHNEAFPEGPDDDEVADDDEDFCECEVSRSIILDVCQTCGKAV